MARCRGNNAFYITMQHSLRRVLVALLLAVAEHTHFTPTPLSSSLLSLSFRRADNNSSTPHGSCCCSVAVTSHSVLAHSIARPTELWTSGCMSMLSPLLAFFASVQQQCGNTAINRPTPSAPHGLSDECNFILSSPLSSDHQLQLSATARLLFLLIWSQHPRWSASSLLLFFFSQTSLFPLLRSAESLCAGWSDSFPLTDPIPLRVGWYGKSADLGPSCLFV